ncbi:MAG: hypothetical protein EOO75_05815 [Myxococcales bacterium]|nr:MAG: hypothetical protein EOO75_05815 [Myxococcales bacterium]
MTTTLRVMTYNVRYFSHATRGVTSTGTSLRRIARALAGSMPPLDLVLLQEVETSSLRGSLRHGEGSTQLERLVGALRQELREVGRSDDYDGHYFAAHNYSLPRGVSLYTTGLAVLVRRPLRVIGHNAAAPHDITHRGRPSLPDGRKPWLKQTRICAHLALDLDGQSLDVFNTHMSLPSFLDPGFWSRPERMGHGPNQMIEARTLLDFIHAHRRSDRFVVGGDFNALPGSPVYRFLTVDHGLHDPLGARLGDLETLKRFATAGFMQLRMHLDHLLSGPGVQWIDTEGSLPFDQLSPFRGLSDHTPLVGQFSI